MKFLITGDLVVNQAYSANQKINKELIELFSLSDCNIVNLEAPVTDSENKIIKTGPHLKSHRESTLDVCKALNIHIAALANNHVKDYDQKGVLDTIAFCHNNGIDTMGAGKNAEDAARTTVLNTPEGKVAIINIAENEWASAEAASAGANGMCLIKDTRKIQQAKQQYDFVFVIVHGGHEYYNLPSPRMQQQYRFYAEQGADLVVGHHTHCISGHEEHNGTPIFYSLGNFLFTKGSPHEDWYIGLVLQVDISDKALSTRLVPIQQSKGTFELGLLQDSEYVRARVEQYSETILDKAKLQEAWTKFVQKNKKNYLSYWSVKIFINNRYLSALVSRLGIRLTSIRALSYFMNMLRCEAHSDLSKAVIKESLNP